MLSLDSIAQTPTELFLGLQQLSVAVAQLTQGTSVGVDEIDTRLRTPASSAPTMRPDSLTITLAFGRDAVRPSLRAGVEEARAT